MTAKYIYIANPKSKTRPLDFLPRVRQHVESECHKPVRAFLELVQLLRPGDGSFELTINIDANREQVRFTLGSNSPGSFSLAVYKKRDPGHLPVVARIVDTQQEPNRELFLSQVLKTAALSSLDKSMTQLVYCDMDKVFSSSAFMSMVRNIRVEGLDRVVRIRSQFLDNDNRISVFGADYLGRSLPGWPEFFQSIRTTP